MNSRFITAFLRACHLTLCSDRQIHSTPPSCVLEFHFNITLFPSTRRSYKWSVSPNPCMQRYFTPYGSHALPISFLLILWLEHWFGENRYQSLSLCSLLRPLVTGCGHYWFKSRNSGDTRVVTVTSTYTRKRGICDAVANLSCFYKDHYCPAIDRQTGHKQTFGRNTGSVWRQPMWWSNGSPP